MKILKYRINGDDEISILKKRRVCKWILRRSMEPISMIKNAFSTKNCQLMISVMKVGQKADWMIQDDERICYKKGSIRLIDKNAVDYSRS